MLDLIAILLFFFASWVFIVASHMAVAKMGNDPDAPMACSTIVAIIITIIGIIIL